MTSLSRPAPYGGDGTVPRLDPAVLEDALGHADLRALLMVAFHLSGDRRWLSAPFLPRRDVRLIADESAGLPPEVQAEIRAGVLALMRERAGRPFAVTDPGDALMLDMMRASMGEAISPRYAPMMREELGFVPRDAAVALPPPAQDGPHVLVVGAGASGLALGRSLKALGLPFLIVEAAEEVGGTWRDNRYPGCGVDTPNHAYSFSRGGRYPWSSFFSPRGDLYAYLRLAKEEFGLAGHIRFGTRVTAAIWDEADKVWTVTLESGGGTSTLRVPVLVSAIGQFGLPAVPAIPGLADFKGPLFHTTQWPEGLDVSGKRVAIIGTGASAMQIVPSIAAKVAHLDIYQRSPQWARPIPRFHEVMSRQSQWLLATLPYYASWFRFGMLWRYGDGLLPYLKKDPAWPHPERSLNAVNDRHRQEMADYMASELAGRDDLIAKCLPDYPPYGKRILLDNGWFRTLRRPNVALVTAPITRVTATGVETDEGLREADIVILSTGFQMTKMAARLNIRGRDGQSLEDLWGDDNATAYLGIAVPGFPNLMIMQGPATGLGHGGSAICQSESQARYIATLIARMMAEGIRAIDVRPDVHDAFVAKVDALHEQLIWTHPGMSTYYRNRHGRVVSVTPFSLIDYWEMTHDPDLADYRIA